MNASLLAIGGMSRSGKSTLASKLQEKLLEQSLKISVISQDDFCLPSALLPTIKGSPDWELPEGVDWDRYHEFIFRQRQENDWVIVEGIFVFDDPVLLPEYNQSIILDIDYSTFMKRRNKEQRWGEEPDWYVQYVWDAYQKRNTKPDQALNFSGNTSIEINAVIQKLALS